MSGTDLVIAKLNAARVALREAKSAQDAHSIVAIAAAAETYARQQQLGEEAIGYAHEIKTEALRRLGEMLRDMPKNTGAKGIGTSAVPQENSTQKLSDLQISRKTSMLAQRIAAMPLAQVQAIAKRETSVTKVMRAEKAVEIARRVSLPDAKYRVIYADPPWSYSNNMPDDFKEQRDHYPVMPLADICALQIRAIAEDDAVLFLWATSPILEESFQVIKAWGFSYKASFVWDKVRGAMGHYNNVAHEFLLICTRGSGVPEVPRLFDSVVTQEKTEHSKKPEIFYDMIETLYPSGKRIELFKRGGDRLGWDSYGHQADDRAA